MIKLQRSKDKQWFFTIHASNNQVLATSETYTRRGGAIKGMVSLAKTMDKNSNFKGGTRTVAFTDMTKAK